MAHKNDRPVVPIRNFGPFDAEYRNQRIQQQEAAAERIREIDAAFVEMSRERAELAARAREIQDELYPPGWFLHGRAPDPHAVGEPLPPTSENAEPVYGRRLRTVCLRLLHRVGRCSLRFLHALLHLHGFAIDSDAPVKALADALGHEADAGRAVRVSRGVYEPAKGLRFRPRRGDSQDDLILPFLEIFDSGNTDLELPA